MCRCNLPRHSERRFCCAACGRAFSDQSVFDAHRYTPDGTDRRACLDPAGVVRHGKPRFRAREIRGADGTPVLLWGRPGSWRGPDATPSDGGDQ